MVIRLQDRPGVIAELSTVLAEMDINIAYMKVFRHEKGEDDFVTVETDLTISDDLLKVIRERCTSILNVITV